MDVCKKMFRKKQNKRDLLISKNIFLSNLNIVI